MVRHHFTPCTNLDAAFERLRSVQFDPIAPVGCNHDLVLQARVAGYRVGDWQGYAYKQRKIYDGWDKMASLIPFEGWPLRRIFYDAQLYWFRHEVFEEHKEAIDAVLKELGDRGPLMPKEFEFQLKRHDWKGHWYGTSVTKQALRALWHSGMVMTSGRKNGQHLYDLTERVVPKHLFEQPRLPDPEAARELVLERHRAMGLLRPGASPEIWSGQMLAPHKKEAIERLAREGCIVPVEVEGMKAHATPNFLNLLDQPAPGKRVVFVAPLDPFMWDRKMTAHLFGFDYSWEIYTPLAKRKWGYYVLPILFGDKLIARAEFWCRRGVLELREWHTEAAGPGADFWKAFGPAAMRFMKYCRAETICVRDHIDPQVRDQFLAVTRA